MAQEEAAESPKTCCRSRGDGHKRCTPGLLHNPQGALLLSHFFLLYNPGRSLEELVTFWGF